MQGNIASIIMAAGKGTRMKSENKAKVLHEILGRPMLFYVLDSLSDINVHTNIIVIGHLGETVQDAVNKEAIARGRESYLFAEQTEQRGTGHAVQTGFAGLGNYEGPVLILSGDMPLIDAEILNKIIETHHNDKNSLTILTAETEAHRDFGRIIRFDNDSVEKIVEAKDCTPEQYAVKEVNLGAYCAEASFLREYLPKLKPNNAQGELYLTDLVGLGNENGHRIGAVTTENIESALGVNNRADLAEAATCMQARIVKNHHMQGVTIPQPANVWIEPDVKIGRDTVIMPGSMLCGKTVIGENCVIGPNTRMTDSIAGDNVNIAYSVLLEAKTGSNINIGPFAYLRPNSVIDDNAKVGDFVEIKNSHISSGAKVPHLTYVGDSDVGAKTNIGCGTITCNYDGVHKHRTTIGANCFIGSNTSLVAPVTVGDGAKTGAGAVITKDVPAGSVVVGVPAKELKH